MENTNETNENGWDLDDDDNWDDWGDAEENPTIEETIKTTTNTKSLPNRTTISEQQRQDNNCNEQQQPAKTSNSNAGGAGGGGWGSLFGGVMSTVLNTATELTSTVTHGLDKVIGVPDPEEMARINASQEARLKAQQQQEPDVKTNEKENDDDDERSLTPTKAGPVFGLNLVNNVTSLGSKVLNTGLDTLEGIGKKTMNILQENDPLLKNKIKKLGLEKEKCNLTEVRCCVV